MSIDMPKYGRFRRFIMWLFDLPTGEMCVACSREYTGRHGCNSY